MKTREFKTREEAAMDTFFPSGDVDLYAVLETAKEASAEEIKKAYRRLALKHHPDKGGDGTRFQQVRSAVNRIFFVCMRDAWHGCMRDVLAVYAC